MTTIVINTDDLRELARRIRAAIERIDQVDRSLRQRAASDPLLGAHSTDLLGTLGRLREVRNILSQDHNELVREITQVELDEGADPGDHFVTGAGLPTPAPPTKNESSPFEALVDTISRLWGSGLDPRAAWVTAAGAALGSTETVPVPGYGSAWDEATERALRDELHRPPRGAGPSSRPSPERRAGGSGGDGPGEDDTVPGGGRGPGAGRADDEAGGTAGSGSGGDGPGEDDTVPGGGRGPGAGRADDEAGGTAGSRAGGGSRPDAEASGHRPGGSDPHDPGHHEGASGGGSGAGSGPAPADGDSSQQSDGGTGEGPGEGEGKSDSGGEGGKSSGGGFGGGSIGDFFDAILENPISAVLAALPLLSNPVGWLGAVALVAMYADELISGISELINDPEAFVAKVGEFMEDSLGDLMAAAEDFVTDPLSAVGDTISTAVEGAAGEIAEYLEDLQDDPLGTIVETVAEVAKLAGVDVGALAGEALGALGEVAPELLETFDELAKAAEGIADVVDTALDTAEVVGDVLAGAEAAQQVLTALGLDELAGILPTTDALVDLVPGASELLQEAGIDPSELVPDLDLGSLSPELQEAFRSAVDVLPIDELPEGLRSKLAEMVGDLELEDLDDLPGMLEDHVVGALRDLAPGALGDLLDHVPSDARAAFDRVLRDAGLGNLDLAHLDLADLPDQVTDDLVGALGRVPLGDLPESIRAEFAEALGQLPLGVLGDLERPGFGGLGSLLSGVPLDELGSFPDRVREQFTHAISELAAADPQGFADRILADAASKVPGPPDLPSLGDLLDPTGLDDLMGRLAPADLVDRLPDAPGVEDLLAHLPRPDDLIDAISELPDLPDLPALEDITDFVPRDLDLPDLPDLPDREDRP